MNIMEQQEKQFKMIFWFLVYCVTFAFAYIICITFGYIPKENIRFADSVLSFLMGTVIGGSFGFLVTGSAQMKKKETPGTTTAEVNATISTTPEEDVNKQK